jgi:hypothetical protein
MIEYTVKEYIQSKDCLDARILAVENLIDSMLITSIDSIDNGGTMSYSLDDGQMKITTQYRSVREVTDGIMGLEKILQTWINRRDGSVIVLRGRLKY